MLSVKLIDINLSCPTKPKLFKEVKKKKYMSGAHMVCEKINLGRRKKSVLGSGGRWGRERTSDNQKPA